MLNRYPRGGVFWLNNYDSQKGSEQSGSRPALIISNDRNNIYSPVITIIPITSKVKTALPTHVTIAAIDGSTEPNIILCEQITTVSKNRLSTFKGILSPDVLTRVEKALAIQLNISTKEDTSPVIKETTTTAPLTTTVPPTTTPPKNNGTNPTGCVGYSEEYKKMYLKDAEKMTNAQLAKKYEINAKAASARKISWAKQFNKN